MTMIIKKFFAFETHNFNDLLTDGKSQKCTMIDSPLNDNVAVIDDQLANKMDHYIQKKQVE